MNNPTLIEKDKLMKFKYSPLCKYIRRKKKSIDIDAMQKEIDVLETELKQYRPKWQKSLRR